MERVSASSAAERARRLFRHLTVHRCTTVAGTLAFFLITSLFPFAFWLLLLFGNSAIAEETVASIGIFGWAGEALAYLRTQAEGAAGGVSLFFLATTLWSSSGFFYHLRRSGEIVYGYRRKKHGWKVRLSALLLTLAVLLFFAGAATLLFAGAVAARFLPAAVGRPALYALLAVLGFFAAWIMNAYAVPYRVPPASTVPGSLLTAVLWLFASAVFAVWLRFGAGERLYGALSLAVAVLLYLYWMMVCFTAGMIANRRRIGVRGLEPKIF